MSYEGYDQYLCANGHIRIFDCWETMECDDDGPFYDEPKRCNCGASFVFHHSVNETNGIIENDPTTKPYLFEIATPAEFHKCLCGNMHVIKETTYKIPDMEGKQ